jgi:microsomal dipeptidase-like Zn-dependent dipeptidase
MLPIADLHCDLLDYLGSTPFASPDDTSLPCSLPHLKAGAVHLQVLAIFTETAAGSAQSAQRQLKAYTELLKRYPLDVCPLDLRDWQAESRIMLLPAIENASGLVEEKEDLKLAFQRLSLIIEQVGQPLYLSLTWNDENRFGGGNKSATGLKPDGIELLHFLQAYGVAVDLSHASDALAHDILDLCAKKAWELPVLASHSNARAVSDETRNLPDSLLREIIRRHGLIGLNFFRFFVGLRWTDLFEHVEHLLNLGAYEHLAFGADFFDINCLGDSLYRYGPDGPFFPELGSSACYPRLLEGLNKHLGLSERTLRALSYENVHHFLERNGYSSSSSSG